MVDQSTDPSPALVTVSNVKKYFPVNSRGILQRNAQYVRAVDDVSFTIKRGETLGLVGESGSGKSTLGRCIVQLHKQTEGQIKFDGVELSTLGNKEMRTMRRRINMIFQDPYSSLSPRMTAGGIIGEPIEIHKLTGSSAEVRDRVEELLRIVGLNPYMADRYPHEFSGGQRQRIGIARAIAAEPEFIVADEPVSALDVSIQAQVINLMQDLQERFNLTYLLIAHDLSVVRHISDRVAVMYLGKLMEIAPCDDLYETPLHPYTQALLSAVPVPDPKVELEREHIVLQGDIPSPISPPSGCVFHTRCPIAVAECAMTVPPLREVAPGHMTACLRVGPDAI
ncbi:MAG: ATP-binding cassette domain-containing protein [Chloroflexi bacterium]|nr:ATP-binding cassette domain-containing protein [Chloroflexota bacterium]MDA1173730.1 ATP-binding cassette domain-containing protein [Chloroflexota bacterium]